MGKEEELGCWGLGSAICSSFLRRLFSLSAYDCDFFNKGKALLPKWNLGAGALPALT